MSDVTVVPNEPDEIREKAALLCGLARWRVAIHDIVDEQSDFVAIDALNLKTQYIAVDSDIVSMYCNPRSGAGYFALRYFGRSQQCHADDYSAAALLAGAVGRYILFDLECKQRSVEARLTLPGHAAEIQHMFNRARYNANIALNNIDKEWSDLREQAVTLSGVLDDNKESDLEKTNKLQNEIKLFIEKMMGSSASLSGKPNTTRGFREIEEANRFGELFSCNNSRVPPFNRERVLVINNFQFGQPINGYPPHIVSRDKFFKNALDKWVRRLRVNQVSMERVIAEIENGFDFKPVYSNQYRSLRLAADAYAMAWVDAFEHMVRNETSNSGFCLKIISGSDRLKREAPHRVINPLQLVKLFVCSQLKKDDADRVIDLLKAALDNLLLFVFSLSDNENPRIQDYLEWCKSLTDFKNAKLRAKKCNSKYHQTYDKSFRDDYENHIQKALSAWRDMINLIAAQESYQVFSDNRVMGQTLFSNLSALLEDNDLDVQKWIENIDLAIAQAEGQLGQTSHWLPIQIVALAPPVVPRNPPPIRLDEFGLIWNLAKHPKSKSAATQLKTILEQIDSKGIELLLGGISLCIIGRWRAARRSLDLAWKSIDKVDSANEIIKTEVGYAYAVCRRITAENIFQLDDAKEFLSNVFKGNENDIRYKTESISLATIRLWANVKSSQVFNNVIQLGAKKILTSALELFDLWDNLSKDDIDNCYLYEYTFQELCCDILQLYWLSIYGVCDGQLYSTKDIDYSDLSPIKRVANALDTQSVKLSPPEKLYPTITDLVRATKILSDAIILEKNIDQLNNVGTLAKNKVNDVIPVADFSRWQFFSLLAKRQLRVGRSC